MLLQQAKIDGIKVFELLDTLKTLDKLQLSFTVAQVLNFNRQKTSTLGFRVENTDTPLEARNIMGYHHGKTICSRKIYLKKSNKIRRQKNTNI